jgi:hypothetical protein
MKRGSTHLECALSILRAQPADSIRDSGYAASKSDCVRLQALPLRNRLLATGKAGASMVRYECDRGGCGSNALLKMRVDPSKSACRSRLQITSSCAGQELAW